MWRKSDPRITGTSRHTYHRGQREVQLEMAVMREDRLRRIFKTHPPIAGMAAKHMAGLKLDSS